MEMKNKNKKAQEELAGFALILVLLGIILLAFLVASLRKSDGGEVRNYEVDSFLQSALQQTTRCELNGRYIDIKDLIFKCEQEATCINDVGEACEVLEEAFNEMTTKSWNMGEGSQYKGYELAVVINEGEPGGGLLIDTITYGETDETNEALQSKGSYQEFSKTGNSIVIYFNIFYD